MRLHVPQDELAEAARWAARQLPTKPLNPIFLGLLLDAHGGQLTLSAFDGTTATRSILDADIETEGTTLLFGRLFADVVGSLGKTDVAIQADGTQATVSTDKARFELETLDPRDYPKLPAIPAVTGTVDGAEFAAAHNRIKAALDPKADGSTAGMSGIRLKIAGDQLQMTATDRYRIATAYIGWQAAGGAADGMGVVPGKVLADNVKAFADDNLQLALPVDGHGTVAMASATRHVTTTLIEFDLFPPRIDHVTPKQYSGSAWFDADDMADTIRQVTTITENDLPVWMRFDGSGHATLRARDNGAASARIAADYEGDTDTFEAALNPQWLLDGLSALTGRIQMDLTTPTAPALLHDSGDDTYSYLVIPYRDPHKAGAK